MHACPLLSASKRHRSVRLTEGSETTDNDRGNADCTIATKAVLAEQHRQSHGL